MVWLGLLASGVLLAIVACLIWGREFGLFGPVFFYDAMRQARRTRFVVLRVGYALLLLAVLFISYRQWAREYHPASVDFFDEVMSPREALPKLGAAAFAAVAAAQFLAVLLLTPIYTATAIGEERDRRTLDLLFSCGLTSREIVVGKLASRLAHVLAVILVGLPILAMLTFLGGVEPENVLAVFLGTLVTALSLGAVGIYESLTATRSFDAVLRTYLAAAGYLALVACVCPSLVRSSGPVLVPYLALHLLVAAAVVAQSIYELRRVASNLGPAARPEWVLAQPRGRTPFHVPRPRPPTRPMRLVLWKETYVERSLLGDHPMLTGSLLLGFMFFGTVLTIFLLSEIIGGWTGQEMNSIIRPLAVAIVGLAVLLVGVGSAGRISRDRERGTLDALLSTALDWNAIILGKALASVRATSFLLGTTAAVWLAGLLGGGINFITFPLLIVAALIHVAFAAFLGLYFSAVCVSTLRAMITTLLALVALFVAPFVWEPATILSPSAELWQLSIGYDYEFGDIPEILTAFVAAIAYGLVGVLLAVRTRRAFACQP